MASQTGKVVENMLGSYMETANEQDSMLDLITLDTPDGRKMQDAGNFRWKNVQQRRPTIDGWDMSNEAGGLIRETYPQLLGTPSNDVITLRADDYRTDEYLTQASSESAVQQNAKLNTALASAMSVQGSMFYRDPSSSAFDFIGEAQSMMDERQLKTTDRTFILNTRNSKTYASDLAARQNTQGMPETVWKSGHVASDVCGFKQVLTGSFLPQIVGDAAASSTVEATAQSFHPRGGDVNETTGVVTNYDYRKATMTVSSDATSDWAVGDKFTLADVYAVGLRDKQNTGELMTFTILKINSATSIDFSPRPIAPASSDTSLTVVEGAYSNINAVIGASVAITRLNVDTSDPKVNLFFDKSAVEIMGGTIPADKYAKLGKHVIHDKLKNGLEVYLLHSGDILATTFTWRLFTWYGITVCNPSNCGVAIKY